jgi:beta-glucanase (GH16 family)
VVQGYNEFDVSTVVRRNGVHTFALRQEDYHSRVYWASKENQRPAIRPELTLSFTTGTARPTPSAATAPAPPATSDPPTPPTPTPTRPSAEASTPAADPSTARPPTNDPGQPPTPAPAGWRPIWADEFNDHTIDKSKWNVRDGEGRDVDLGCNVDDPKNSFESGGRLTIRALNETTRCGSQTRPYTQAYLDTIGKASFTYGRFEMRAKSPNQKASSQGLWPAFWLRPDGGGNGEIDVVELPGGQDWYDKATLGIFWDYTPVKQDTRVALPSGYPGDGFHTYTTEWEPGVLRWYLDGKLVWQRDRNTTPWFDKAFSRPYNIRLNFQVGGWLGNPTGSTAFPADFAVDYVRVWQR